MPDYILISYAGEGKISTNFYERMRRCGMKYFMVIGSFTEGVQRDAAFREVLKRHHAFTKKLMDEGKILFAGPRPAGGGVLVMKGESLEEVEGWFEEDPFKTENINTYEFIEFICFDGQDFVMDWFKK